MNGRFREWMGLRTCVRFKPIAVSQRNSLSLARSPASIPTLGFERQAVRTATHSQTIVLTSNATRHALARSVSSKHSTTRTRSRQANAAPHFAERYRYPLVETCSSSAQHRHRAHRTLPTPYEITSNGSHMNFSRPCTGGVNALDQHSCACTTIHSTPNCTSNDSPRHCIRLSSHSEYQRQAAMPSGIRLV